MRELCRIWGFGNDLSPVQKIFKNTLLPALTRGQTIVCVCVGTDKVLGDCFGAVMGDCLLFKRLPIYVYGGTQNNVSARNIDATLKVVNLVHPNALIIVFDTLCTTNRATIGDIVLSGEYIGVNPKVNICADLFVYGVTTYLSPTRHNLFSRLNIIKRLSKILTDCFACEIQNATRQNLLGFLQKVLN